MYVSILFCWDASDLLIETWSVGPEVHLLSLFFFSNYITRWSYSRIDGDCLCTVYWRLM